MAVVGDGLGGWANGVVSGWWLVVVDVRGVIAIKAFELSCESA